MVHFEIFILAEFSQTHAHDRFDPLPSLFKNLSLIDAFCLLKVSGRANFQPGCVQIFAVVVGHAAQICVAEIGALKVRGGPHFGAVAVGVLHVGIIQLGTQEIRIVQLCSLEVCLLHLGTLQNALFQIGALKIGSLKIRSL